MSVASHSGVDRDPLSRVGRGGLSSLTQVLHGIGLHLNRLGEFEQLPAQIGEHGLARPLDERLADVGRGDDVEPVPDLLDGRVREHRIVGSGVGDDEQRVLPHAGFEHAVHEVAAHGTQCAARHAVENDRGAHAARMRVDERLPSARVSVPGGSRHEEPQVGGVQEATRELPIVAVDRVQVGRVHEDEAGYGVLHHFQAPHVDDRVPFQRFGVLGVDSDDGYPGRGPDDRRGRDVLAQEGVEDRGLARTRRPAEHHDRGQAVPAQMGQDARGQLRAQTTARLVELHRTGELERQARIIEGGDRPCDEVCQITMDMRGSHVPIVRYNRAGCTFPSGGPPSVRRVSGPSAAVRHAHRLRLR